MLPCFTMLAMHTGKAEFLFYPLLVPSVEHFFVFLFSDLALMEQTSEFVVPLRTLLTFFPYATSHSITYHIYSSIQGALWNA